MPLLTLTFAVASAASWTAEDLVAAHQRGLPESTATAMASSIGGGTETAIYLLRRGVPTAVVQAWGYPVAEAEGLTAERLGRLDAPSPVSDTDWYEMRELPAGIERVGAATVSGDVITVEPDHALVLGRPWRMDRVERRSATDVWVDARPLGVAIRDQLEDAPVSELARSGDTRSEARKRLDRGRVNVGLGGGLLFLGGLTMVAGAGFSAPNAYEVYEGGHGTPTEPNPLLMALGGIGLVAGGFTFQYGARQIALAGPYAAGIHLPGLPAAP